MWSMSDERMLKGSFEVDSGGRFDESVEGRMAGEANHGFQW